MKKRLYIVSTYYHALISCIKQLTEPCDSDILVTNYIPGGYTLYERIKESGIFSGVYWNDSVTEYKPSNKIDYVLSYHRKNARIVENQLSVSIQDYDNIQIFHEDTWFAHYLKDKKIKHHLNEDALDIYKIISQTAFSYMLPKKNLRFLMKSFLRIGYVFCGYDKYTECVEINDGDGIEISDFVKGKLSIVPRKELFERLGENDIDILKSIFAKNVPERDYSNSVLLLTQPLFADGRVKSLDEQLERFRKLAEETVGNGEELVVKPHPRDTADYSSVFDDAIIIDKNMPAEMLKYICPGGFKRIAKLTSCTVIY
ncbi:MAG: hypothetical protein IJZ65_09535 [Ruminiclostridium sp.]|nr:hypothetical protein [Ruminiclostridium sp.]